MFTFSVMGDSISSFEGTSPENYAVTAGTICGGRISNG